ncbi:hypothetical protein A3A54_01910 [Candidatus Curtissbacteria bacterium RIFCSPLOWO2_01_FULL_39_62]|uniref:Uncharacterized protein n=2 Tax=Candidatus Curtissiibacteriota TaxID=1752717 RepID=A0A1F5GA77_9BACT|nr:MAG: hypothetical protein US98_C0026G0004 [Parcubacteria group bacterium GW2011_GWC1_38_6]OGD83883.1 MAG: hypothetical protein A2775_00715 [Candidatus Curtissbacteria bacterium RIFCSPHIGHO2_01_FULL_39_57]OGD88781.1 MAG: hypothetical protein A3D04_04455 [Candidatus Curtissbacteria bacterium RIFCSPHIGHO2_02_FULL_40_16b]OGD90521.1 MAG: hypothetical protein A3E11_02605 [Candidatus Curtissbacteria bacterium RIFCSPHIGHO2_12_FULL_38_37]OGD99730.1 MAG: hypothetical protein A3J17_00230 [Candidatus Cu
MKGNLAIAAAFVAAVVVVVNALIFINKFKSVDESLLGSSPKPEESPKYNIEDFRFTKEEHWTACAQGQCFQKTILRGDGILTKEGDINEYIFVTTFDLLTITNKLKNTQILEKDCSIPQNQTPIDYSATTLIEYKGKTKEIKYPGCQEELEQIEKLFPKSRTN